MPRGIGDRHYCTFNLCGALSFSAVELYLPNDLWESDLHYCLWAYLNSSLVWLFREVTGRKNLGGGLLKAEATDLKALPILFQFDFHITAREVFESLRGREPLPIFQELYTEEHLHIDEMVANYFDCSGEMECIRSVLLEQVKGRVSKAQARN